MKTKSNQGTQARSSETLLSGWGVSDGIVIGPAFVLERGTVQVPEYMVPASKVAAEVSRLEDAVDMSRAQLEAMKERLAKRKSGTAEDLGDLLDVYMRMLTGSRLIRGSITRIKENRVNAEAAVQATLAEFTRDYATIDDSYLAARIHDIEDVSNRLLRNLQKKDVRSFSNLPRGSIIIAEDITPADTALMEPGRIGGFISELGGAQSHTAIMARSLSLPAVLAAHGTVAAATTGDLVIVDGRAGRVIVRPNSETVTEYEMRRAAFRKERRQLYRMRKLPAVTKNGVEVCLQANIELPAELEAARVNGAAGVGLLRTEFFFMNRDAMPDEEEQVTVLTEMVKGMEGRPVTLRTLDIGGDKLAKALSHELDPEAAEEENPALGLRAIRLSLRFPHLLRTQLAAMLRAGAHGPVRILLPMISSPDEMTRVREILNEVADGLRAKGVAIADPLPPLGAMIEVPAAAINAKSLAEVADFFSIGTNDLIQYTLALDRGNEHVADLYDAQNPAVLYLIQAAVKAAQEANIPVNVCGEMAGDESFTELLLSYGLRDLSMSVGALSRVKQTLRALIVS